VTHRILIVDDHPLMRLALRTQIEGEPGWSVAGEAANGREAVEKAAALQPDIILMDVLMPEMDGVTAIQNILQARPECHILVLTSSADNRHLAAALRAGATGYLLKDAPLEELLRAIRDVGEGRAVLPPALVRHWLQGQPVSDTTPASDPDGLTEREQEVLACLGRGASNRQIADQLSLSESTVRTHVRNILGKLHLSNRTEAALYAVQSKTQPGSTPSSS